LKSLRHAREMYEREVVHRSEGSKFWKGLVNRWNKALDFARSFFPAGVAVSPESVPAAEAVPFDASGAAIANAMARSNSQLQPTLNGGHIMFANPSLSDVQIPISLPALRLGSQGDLVRAWQSFLTGQGFDPGGLDGVFGDKSVAATQAFQRKSGLTPDGVAGRQTILSAMALGFELIDEPAPDTSGSNFPPRPDFAPLVSTAARQAVFGRFDFVAEPTSGNRENIRILGSWLHDNIFLVPIPQLRRALGPDAPAGMQFHRAAAEQLKGLWAEWEEANLLSRILSFDGSFAPRFIRGSRTNLSNHAFGSAFDINAEQNRLGTRPPLVGQHGSVRELVPIANKWGFYWGGHFGGRQDGMHFEIAFIKHGASARIAPQADVEGGPQALLAAGLHAPPAVFTLHQGKRYRATVTLNFFEQFASNETIEEMLKTAGFTDVRVTGDGTTRVAKGRWMRPDITGPVDPHLSDILELP
jgi:peptidoglycan hydrolase-like protein with peptidoglycan-binding domain